MMLLIRKGVDIKSLVRKYDCVIMGAGMFGLYAASWMASKGAKVAILEKEKTIFGRASKTNQSRVHRGYHYPRSLETAQKLSQYYQRFCHDFNFALLTPFQQYYAISREYSKVSTNDYVRFCKNLNIPLKEIDSLRYFKKNTVDATFEADESCFNNVKIKEYFLDRFATDNQVDIFYLSFPISHKISNSKYMLRLNNSPTPLVTQCVINTTYTNINEVNKFFGFPGYSIKYELCELKLCKMDGRFPQAGLTVIDGPFFSFMPYAYGHLFTLSSVNDTPIDISYSEAQDIEKHIAKRKNTPRAELLARSYLRQDIRFSYQSSMFEIKPILLSSEADDSRPTLVTIHAKKPAFMSILPGKISTIYDLDQPLHEVMKTIGN